MLLVMSSSDSRPSKSQNVLYEPFVLVKMIDTDVVQKKVVVIARMMRSRFWCHIRHVRGFRRLLLDSNTCQSRLITLSNLINQQTITTSTSVLRGACNVQGRNSLVRMRSDCTFCSRALSSRALQDEVSSGAYWRIKCNILTSADKRFGTQMMEDIKSLLVVYSNPRARQHCLCARTRKPKMCYSSNLVSSTNCLPASMPRPPLHHSLPVHCARPSPYHHEASELSAMWIPFGCCSRRVCVHPQVAFRRRSNVAGPEGYPPCPESCS